MKQADTKRQRAKRGQPTKRAGTAFWFPDEGAELLRSVAAKEERTLQAVMLRALRMYAERNVAD